MHSLLRELFHRHHDVPVVEGDVRRSRELERRPAGSNLLDIEMHGARSDFKPQGQTHLAKLCIRLLNPVLKTIGRKRAHIPGKDEMDEVSDGFALVFRSRMQLEHDGV
jgi:hypothetical protein